MNASPARPQPDGEGARPQIDWPAVLATHDRWLRTVVYARVGEFQAVDEVMQDVSMAAVRQQTPIADPEKVAPWLYRLAVMQSLLYRRKQGRRRKLLDRYARRTMPSGCDRGLDPLGWLLAEERRAQIRTALGRVPQRNAEILLLKYTEDWSYRQLARRLGVSESAVEAQPAPRPAAPADGTDGIESIGTPCLAAEGTLRRPELRRIRCGGSVRQAPWFRTHNTTHCLPGSCR